MANYGLRIWDASGNLTLDISEGSGLIVAFLTGSVAGNSNSGGIYVPGASASGSEVIFTRVNVGRRLMYGWVYANDYVRIYNTDPATQDYRVVVINFLIPA